MPVFTPFDWYETPLYYDIVFDADTDMESDFLCDVHTRYGETRGRRVLEPACGSGRLVAALAERGFGVRGFDLNEAMLRFARRRLAERKLKAQVSVADMADFSFPERFDFAHCLVSSFKYLITEASARAHLRCMARALKPGGVYVLGLHLSEYHDRTRSRERWVASRDGTDVVCNIQGWPSDPVTRTERVRSRLIVRTRGGEEKRYETSWTFRTYDLGQLRILLRAIPEFEHVDTYDFRLDIDRPMDFDGEYLDNVLILRRV